jgi:polysaccharide pyruvyl transferase CsaB
MPRILICGAAGYGNIGDDAILEGMLAQLRGTLEAQFTVIGGDGLARAADRLRITALQHEDEAAWLQAIEDADLVLIGGGGLLYDSTFIPRLDDLLRPRSQWLYQSVKIASAARAAGKTVALYGIGVGPLLTDAGRRAARFVADCAEWSTTRDAPSANALVALRVPSSRIYPACDPAMFLPSSPPDTAADWLTARGLDRLPRPWIMLNVRPWPVFPDSPHARERRGSLYAGLSRMADLVMSVSAGSVLLLPLQIAGEDDRAALTAIEEAADRRERVRLLDPAADPALAQAIMGAADVLVGMRLHSLILAANAGTPFVALSYDPKVDAFAAEMSSGARCFSIENLSPDDIASSVNNALAERDDIRAQMATAVERMRAKGAISAELAAATLSGGTQAAAVCVRPAPATAATADSDALPRVLMQIRPDWETNPGGDSIQLRGTKAELERIGVSVSVSTDLQPDLGGFDIVHAFNTTRPQESLKHCANARRQGKPAVLSTVYWDAREFLHQAQKMLEADFEPSAPEIAALTSREAQAAVVLSMADLLLPNSEAERDLLVRNFGVPERQCRVVPNAVDDRFFEATANDFVSARGLQDFVLCVGRIELRKNQYALLAALQDTDLPLVLIGPPMDDGYLERCRARATPRVTFIPEMPHELLPSAYAAARVHVLPSWYDTPGLVSLEAAAAGCNIVSTDRGSAREYFGDMAWYCSPDDVDSIRRAVTAAWEAPRGDRLRRHVRENFTWAVAARKTLDAYRAALAAHTGAETASQIARDKAQIDAYRQYVRALEDNLAVQRDEYEGRIGSLEEHVKSLEPYIRALEQRLASLDRIYQSQIDQAAEAIKQRDREIKAITARRLYRWSEWLALRLRWLLRRG